MCCTITARIGQIITCRVYSYSYTRIIYINNDNLMQNIVFGASHFCFLGSYIKMNIVYIVHVSSSLKIQMRSFFYFVLFLLQGWLMENLPDFPSVCICMCSDRHHLIFFVSNFDAIVIAGPLLFYCCCCCCHAAHHHL